MSVDRGKSPLPGESPATWVTLAVICALSTLGLIVVGVVSLTNEGLGSTIAILALLAAGSGIAAALFLVQRRRHIRRVRSGDVIEREPWSGADLLPPG